MLSLSESEEGDKQVNETNKVSWDEMETTYTGEQEIEENTVADRDKCYIKRKRRAVKRKLTSGKSLSSKSNQLLEKVRMNMRRLRYRLRI